jgi:molecular chaperone GrpE
MAENEEQQSVAPGNGGGEATTEQIDKLKQERDDLYDRLIRKQAEFENFRKRMERERAEFAQFASSELMKELLNALDSFELAIRNASGDESILKGLELIYKQLQDILARFGLKPVEAKGKEFDPNYHQAVATEYTDDVDENTVIEELRKGYLLHGRLLRPAMVSVAVRKAS